MSPRIVIRQLSHGHDQGYRMYTLSTLNGVKLANIWVTGSEYPKSGNVKPTTEYWELLTVQSLPKDGLKLSFAMEGPAPMPLESNFKPEVGDPCQITPISTEESVLKDLGNGTAVFFNQDTDKDLVALQLFLKADTPSEIDTVRFLLADGTAPAIFADDKVGATYTFKPDGNKASSAAYYYDETPRS